MASPVFVTSDEVKKVLNWPLVNESVEEALKSVLSKEKLSEDTPYACQNARTFTQMHNNGVMLSMPGYVGNHTVTVDGVAKKLSTLACKLVTSVKTNEQLTPPMPSILANIMLLDAETGQLQCVMDGTQITAWRTGSASIVATKYLLFPRVSTDISAGISLAIVGCGVQGRIHAIGMCSVFNVKEVCLWNRTASKAEQLAAELEACKDQFINQNVKVKVLETVGECVGNADVVVTATYAKEPVIHLGMLKKDVHINAIGAGAVHYSELSQDIYDVASVYVDHWAGAHSELKGLKTNIVCELGEVIVGKQFPAKGVTVFQSMGMAVEDATVAQAIFQHIKK